MGHFSHFCSIRLTTGRQSGIALETKAPLFEDYPLRTGNVKKLAFLRNCLRFCCRFSLVASQRMPLAGCPFLPERKRQEVKTVQLFSLTSGQYSVLCSPKLAFCVDFDLTGFSSCHCILVICLCFFSVLKKTIRKKKLEGILEII